jgi:DNA topoisomerase-1
MPRDLARALPPTWRRLVTADRQAKSRLQRTRRRVATLPSLDPISSAEMAELRYVDDRSLTGIRRVGHKRPRYVYPSGRTVSDRAVLERIRSLAIPPAWTDVWICPLPLGHLQATGRDARGRKQYRYHPRWREIRDEVKYGRLLAFASALAKLRARTDADLRRPGLLRNKVIAAVIQILEKTLIRVGNREYVRDNQSFGLTTLRDRHTTVKGPTVRFQFRGKSGISHVVDLRDARLARIVKACRDLPGQELFQYVDARGKTQVIGSGDVNRYVRGIAGQAFSSKDFRTWAGTVLAACGFAEIHATGKKPARRHVVLAIESVAKRLGNTAAVCRKCYVHPAVIEAYMDGEVIDVKRPGTRMSAAAQALSPEEAAVVALLSRRLHQGGYRRAS